MLMNVSENLKEGAQFFVEYKIKNASDLKEFSMRMKEYESKGDSFIHENHYGVKQSVYHSD